MRIEHLVTYTLGGEKFEVVYDNRGDTVDAAKELAFDADFTNVRAVRRETNNVGGTYDLEIYRGQR